MAGSTASGSDEPKINPEDRARIARSQRQLVAYANLLRWTATFQRDEIVRHPNHDQVMLLSPIQSGRFCFAIEGETVLLGVQQCEAAWLAAMPIDSAYVSDRLYLIIDGVACMNDKFSPLALGIFVDDVRKRRLMANARFLQPIRVTQGHGKVVDVGGKVGKAFPVKQGDIIKQLVLAAREKLRQQDIGRFF